MNSETHNSARQALGIIVQGYCAMIAAAFDDARAVLRISRAMQRHVRRQVKLIAVFDRLALRAELLRNPEMRARVRDDLGGERGMAAWQARRHSARVAAAFRAANGPETGEAESNRPALSPESNSSEINSDKSLRPRMPYAPPTDRFGHFRLAPIARGVLVRPRATAARPRTIRATQRRFMPIPVTPEDLTGGAPSAANPNFPKPFQPNSLYPPPQSMPLARSRGARPPDRWP